MNICYRRAGGLLGQSSPSTLLLAVCICANVSLFACVFLHGEYPTQTREDYIITLYVPVGGCNMVVGCCSVRDQRKSCLVCPLVHKFSFVYYPSGGNICCKSTKIKELEKRLNKTKNIRHNYIKLISNSLFKRFGVCVHIAHCLFYSLLQWVCISSTITPTGSHGSHTDTLSTRSLLSSTAGCSVVKTVINFLKGWEAHNHMWMSYKVSLHQTRVRFLLLQYK